MEAASRAMSGRLFISVSANRTVMYQTIAHDEFLNTVSAERRTSGFRISIQWEKFYETLHGHSISCDAPGG
jgi:hypothetical protein